MRKALVALFGMLCAAQVAAGAVGEHYEEGPIQIQEAGPFDTDKQVILEVGDKVAYKIKVYQDEFFGQTVISANAHMENATDRKVKAVYSISFHDKDGRLIACHQGSWDLDPGGDVNYGSGIVYTDAQSIARIAGYKLRTQVLPAKE